MNLGDNARIKFDERYYSGCTGNMKTAISLPDNLFRKADQYAKSHGYSRSELFAKAVEQYLEAHPSDYITKQLDELNATLSIMQFRSIEKEEW